jgi:hypothetical protein
MDCSRILVSFVKGGDYEAAAARNARVLAVIDTVTSFLPGGKLKDVLLSPVVDVDGAVKEAFTPGPSWDKSVAEVNRFRAEANLQVRALVVKTLYESGQLDPPNVLVPTMKTAAREIHGGSGGEMPTFFNPLPPAGDGHLIPYGDLKALQRDAFNLWVDSYVQKYPVAGMTINKAHDAFTLKLEDLDTR